jgi:hypothetical protein
MTGRLDMDNVVANTLVVGSCYVSAEARRSMP